MQAERKFARVPASKARKPRRARSARRSGASADPAELDADRAEIREAAKGERRDRERARVERRLSIGQAARKAINSLRTARVPSRLPTAVQSRHGTPSRYAAGASAQPKIVSNDKPTKPNPLLISAIRPRNAMSIAPMFNARLKPSRVPREAASRTFASGRSRSGRHPTEGLRHAGFGHHQLRE